jgi:Ni,Fe-hydrogenase III large subunit
MTPPAEPIETQNRALSRIVDEAGWLRQAADLVTGHDDLLGLWSDGAAVYMAVAQAEAHLLEVSSLPCPDRHFPSVGRLHPPALRLERAIFDLYGIEPQAAPDRRPWLDHGRWGLRHPCSNPVPADAAGDPYAFLLAEGAPLHQIPVGPVHAGIIEPGHFRFTANGEIVVRLEERLGYAHKGTSHLMAGAPIAQAARLAGRVSGDSTVAYALAFARAVEMAQGRSVPRRAVLLRALMAELERIANHFGDIGAVCNDASFALIHAHCGILRERVLRAAHAAFGHRLMMDRIVPGGVTADLSAESAGQLRILIRDLGPSFAQIVDVYDKTASLQDRTVHTGILRPELARAYACGGFVGRASGRSFDARRFAPYAPYDELTFEVPVRTEGDVDARVRLRIDEVSQSIALVGQILDRLPNGPLLSETPATGGNGEGLALVEGFRGDIFVWVRTTPEGRVEACHLRDPSWFQWPLLEAVIEGNIVADFPLCNKSFNCSYSGHDL